MARESVRFLILVALLSVVVYLVEGLLAGGLGGGLARGLVVVAGIVAAAVLSPVWHLLVRFRQRARPPILEAMTAELAVQASAGGVAAVLAAHVRQLTDATVVAVYLGDELLVAVPRPPEEEPAAIYALGAADRAKGELRCYGAIRDERLMARLLRVGALAFQNALLAERAAAAEQLRSQAQAQRDLQHRLTWTITTQVCTLLEETREELETVRLCAATLPPDLLAKDLESLSERFRLLEAFVHDNLRNANSI